MKTPKEYTKNLKNHIITEDMIGDCYKDQLLSFFEPVCIHKQFAGYVRIRVYDYEDDYDEQDDRNIVWENCYYDHDYDREVWFYDYETDMEKHLYFLYYVIGKYSFHTPINDPNNYDYPIKEIDDDFFTEGRDVTELISAQFVIKVLEMLATEECELHINGDIIHHKPKAEKPVIKKSRATREPSGRQLDYIDAICEFYKCDKPQPKTFGQASKWLDDFLKAHDFASDKRKAETKERYSSILNDHLNGLSIEQLIDKYKLSKATIKKAIKTAQTYEQ